MKRILIAVAAILATMSAQGQDIFPDGTPVSEWFRSAASIPDAPSYVITEHGVKNDSTLMQTEAIQRVIDLAHFNGGGRIIIPEGTFLSGSLFFKPGTTLEIRGGGTLKGSDDISDFKVIDTRLEGRCIRYFAALINAEGVDGFSITGSGTVNGNGERYWKSFWLRREVNPQCTNLEELRPRLIYITDCKDVHIEGVHLENSPFWTTHLYKCERVRIHNVSIFAPAEPVKAPSSDAIDIDVCNDVHIKGCLLSVNDDAIALKGGKGPWADKDPENGPNMRIIIEDCTFGYCHSALTCGSESIHNRNVIFRNCRVDKAGRLLWLKMRPDTPQLYEHFLVEGIIGNAGSFLYIQPWTQFFDLQDRKDIPMSYASGIRMKDITMDCRIFFDVIEDTGQYLLSDFIFEDLDIKADNTGCNRNAINGFIWNNVNVR